MKIEINDFAVQGITNEVKKLYLSFLYTLEDLRDNEKLSPEDFDRLRKRVLDYGNNTIRNLTQQLDNFDFSLKSNEDTKQQ